MTPILPFFSIFAALAVHQIYLVLENLKVKYQRSNIKDQKHKSKIKNRRYKGERVAEVGKCFGYQKSGVFEFC